MVIKLNDQKILKRICFIILFVASSYSSASIDMVDEIQLYNDALMDKDATGTAEVYRFNSTYVSVQKECISCVPAKIIGIPGYSVFVNNMYVSSFHIQNVLSEVPLTESEVEKWVLEAFTNVNGTTIVDKNVSQKQVFVSTDRFIEEHFSASSVKDDFLQYHREFIDAANEVAPKLVEIAVHLRESMQSKCLNAAELPQIMSNHAMFAFLAAVHSIVDESDTKYILKMNQAVLEGVDCNDDLTWVDNVHSRMLKLSKE